MSICMDHKIMSFDLPKTKVAAPKCGGISKALSVKFKMSATQSVRKKRTLSFLVGVNLINK